MKNIYLFLKGLEPDERGSGHLWNEIEGQKEAFPYRDITILCTIESTIGCYNRLF